MTPRDIRDFRRTVYRYYRAHRRDMPWRWVDDPYKVFVSEVMLQQTQVERVYDKYRAFLRAFPTLAALRRAPLKRVLAAWQGLGYNRRALALSRAAALIATRHGGKIPDEVECLQALPGIGAASAGAIRAFAFNKPSIIIETNIRSVFIHHFFQNRRRVPDDRIRALVEATLDRRRPREWYYALMDYGVSIKEKFGNPARRGKAYRRQPRFEGSDRQVRGHIVKTLVRAGRADHATLCAKIGCGQERIRPLLGALVAEELIRKEGCLYFI